MDNTKFKYWFEKYNSVPEWRGGNYFRPRYDRVIKNFFEKHNERNFGNIDKGCLKELGVQRNLKSVGRYFRVGDGVIDIGETGDTFGSWANSTLETVPIPKNEIEFKKIMDKYQQEGV